MKKPTKGNKVTVLIRSRSRLRKGTLATPLGHDGFTASLQGGGWATCLAKDEGSTWVRGWHGNESVDGKALLAAAALTEVKAPTGVRYYAVDGVHGDDPSAGFSDVSPAEASTRAFKTLGELRAALPAAGGSRKIEITISRGGGVVDGVKLHWPDRVVVVRGAK